MKYSTNFQIYLSCHRFEREAAEHERNMSMSRPVLYKRRAIHHAN